MSEKMTLTVYLERKGQKAKALKRVEAEAFGIPYPLLAGWPARHGDMEITPAMLERIANSPKSSRISTLAKMARAQGSLELSPEPGRSNRQATAAAPAATPSRVPGFVLRPPRRARSRRPAPWT